MEMWVGPAIVAAVISGLVNIIALFVGGTVSHRLDVRRRKEKIRDYLIALRAEIRSELHNLRSMDMNGHFEDIATRYSRQGDYVVYPSHPTRHVIFEVLKNDLPLLPESVIDTVVVYARQRQVIERIVEDMREDRFKSLGPERQLDMYRDYISMQIALAGMAEDAVAGINQALGETPGFNNQVSAPSGRLSGGEH